MRISDWSSDVCSSDLEAGQLGSRQAQRILQISHDTGARVLLLGDNKQTGAIEQGKPFWLMQKLGLPTAELTEAVRQQTRAMKTAVATARSGDYAASLQSPAKNISGEIGRANVTNPEHNTQPLCHQL